MKKMGRWVALALLALIVSIFFWRQTQRAAERDREAAAIEEGDRLLAEAGARTDTAARDLRVKALRQAEEVLRFAPQSESGWILLGRAQSALGEKAKACQAFDRILAREPGNLDALREAGIAYFERWRLSKDHAHRVESQANLERALVGEPSCVRCLYYLGLLHHESEEFETRDRIWEKLGREAPDSAESREAVRIKSSGSGGE